MSSTWLKNACQIIFGFCVLVVYSAPLLAEAVGLENGQGWLFNHRGNCYLVLPAHVAGQRPELQFFTSTPVVNGDARPIRNFTTAHDLAIAYVAPGFEDRCKTPWSSIADDITNVLDVGASVTLTEVRSSGLVDSLQGRIEAYDSYYITLTPDEGDSLYQGRSGSSLTRDGKFIGMAIEARGSSEGIFLRADEIRDELRGLIERTSVVNRPSSSISSSAQCENSEEIYSRVRCSAPALSEKYVCSGLLSGQKARFAADSLPLVIELTLNDEAALDLTSFSHRITVEPDETTTTPKSVLVLVDSSDGDRRRWKKFGSRDTAPDGSFLMNNGSRPFTRHIQFVVQSAWDNDKPVDIGCLTPQ